MKCHNFKLEEAGEARDLAGVGHAAGGWWHGREGDIVEGKGGGSGVDDVTREIKVTALDVTIMQWGKSVAYTGPGRPARACRTARCTRKGMRSTLSSTHANLT